MTEAMKETIWLKGILKDFGVTQKHVVILCDNQNTLRTLSQASNIS